MSRLAKLNLEDWDPELRRTTGADTGAAIEIGPMQILAHCPSIAKAVAGLGAAERPEVRRVSPGAERAA